MTVLNMTNSRGNVVKNQFIVTGESNIKYFQSYNSIICMIVPHNYKGNSQWEKKDLNIEKGKVYLDSNKWDYSVTTGKYRNIFLGENKAETQKRIDSGEYILTDLN